MSKKNKKNVTPPSEWDVPWENLFEAFENADRRNSIVETMFRERIELLQLCNSRGKMKFLQKSILEDMMSQCKIQNEEIQLCEQKKNDIQEERKALQKKIAELQKELERVTKVQNKYQKDLEKKERELEEQKENMDEINTIVLVHPTANIKEIINYSLAEIRVTSNDEKMFKGLKPDKVVEYPTKGDELISMLPQYQYCLEDKYISSAKNSIIAYCELVAHTLMEVDEEKQKVILLFHNEDITTILAANGLV